MSSLRNAKLAFSTIRNLVSKILVRSRCHSVREANHQLKQHFVSADSLSSYNNINISRVSCNSWYPSIHSKLNTFHAFGKQNHRARLFINGARRFYHGSTSYHANKNQIRRRRRNILLACLVGGGVAPDVWGSERIPYSKRIHLILLSKDYEKKIGESAFYDLIYETYKGKLLPGRHPKSVRVRLITNHILVGLQRQLRHDQVGSDNGQAKKGSNVTTQHLEGLQWEVAVIDDPEEVNAYSYPSGKIVVFTGFLDHFKTNAEIAIVIGHEVGHIVARPGAEGVSNRMCFLFLRIILRILSGGPTTTLNKIVGMMEKEADYIGLLLLASAGYDPRGAPEVYEKLGKIGVLEELGEFWRSLISYLSTHPSGKTGAELLAQDKVMEEAISIYRESVSLKYLSFWICIPSLIVFILLLFLGANICFKLICSILLFIKDFSFFIYLLFFKCFAIYGNRHFCGSIFHISKIDISPKYFASIMGKHAFRLSSYSYWRSYSNKSIDFHGL
ncbi:hypothetical protein MKW98_006579 [Papaver atlanticum]|uniref:Peptidase M48 domain-containing protein n=1 Tax=Papaver atlanticum TaxID=357466 RepID=A0AAD4XSN5_9MAGN|nr:hypothetical protein MKW98_006579 [Papaver atlanticum]